MLRLKNITKVYPVAGQKLQALKGINLSFRKNEFVSILGPSGCGKTTTLNIIGGLDKYTDGDLFIAGTSTKQFKDHDWDIYRNRRIGFIFQSYNLIPHQTVLENVELALTISGIKKEERIERAKKALDKVGLTKEYNKRPNQLSGGQCQRVAIARALVNEPEILLADEPTGALDTKTSVQIMDLIKEIAQDRLVIMVTHNPELAEQYSSRIIRLVDGLVVEDSNPFSEEDEIEECKKLNETQVTKTAKAKMSLLQAIRLSTRNLLSKKKRTILTAFAGSIGIIGISAVLAVSTGVKNYIASMEDDMLSGNPITVQKTAFDISALTGGQSFSTKAEALKKGEWVNVQSIIGYLVENEKALDSLVSNNEINKDYIDYIMSMPKESYNAISLDYGIDMTAAIYTDYDCGDTTLMQPFNRKISLNAINQTYASAITKLDSALPEEERKYAKYADAITSLTSPIAQSIPNNDYVLTQYDVLDGRMPENDNECLLVVSKNETLTDLVLAQIGLYSQQDFYNLVYSKKSDDAMEGDYVFKNNVSYTDIYNKKYTWYPNDTIYNYNESVVEALQNNIGSATTELFMACMSSTDTDVRTAAMTYMGLMSSGTDEQKEEAQANLLLAVSKTTDKNIEQAYAKVTAATTAVLTSDSIYGYNYEADPSWTTGKDLKIVGILKPKDNISYGCLSQGLLYSEGLSRSAVKTNKDSSIVKYVKDNRTITYNGQTVNTGISIKYNLKYYWETKLGTTTLLAGEDVNSVYVGRGNSMSAIMKAYGLSSSSSTSTTMSIASLAGSTDANGNIIPEGITIYPINFEKKDAVTDYLDAWNDIKSTENEGSEVTFNEYSDDFSEVIKVKTLSADERQEIKYTDSVELIINMINTMINVITIALISFTALSLVVSSVMISIITYVSVVERVKEIGIIRALGGRKKDVSHLFNAETLIIGLASGLVGIGITYILAFIVSTIVKVNYGIAGIATLTPLSALIMVLLSVGLTMLSGLAPARKAATQDPVVALRTE